MSHNKACIPVDLKKISTVSFCIKIVNKKSSIFGLFMLLTFWIWVINPKLVITTYFLCLWLLLFPKFSQNLWASLNLVCLSFPCSLSVPFARLLCELLVLWGDEVKPESDPQEYSSNVIRKALFFFFFRRPQIEELDEDTFPDKSPSDFDDGTD